MNTIGHSSKRKNTSNIFHVLSYPCKEHLITEVHEHTNSAPITMLDWVGFLNLSLSTLVLLIDYVVKGGASKVHVTTHFYDTNLETNIWSMGWIMIPRCVQCNISERCRVGRSFLSDHVMRSYSTGITWSLYWFSCIRCFHDLWQQ